MNPYKYQLARCWTYAYGQFTDQAQRFAMRTSTAPRMARDVVARLHGFDNWANLARTLQDLQDIGCALALEMEHGEAEAAFRASVFAQVDRLASLKRRPHVRQLARALKPGYGGFEAVPDLDDEGLSDTELEALGQYEDIKWEMAYRTLWTRAGANSANVQNIGIELAERLAAWYPQLAADAESALSIVFAFYGCRSESRVTCSAGPIAEYFGKEYPKERRISDRLALQWDKPMPWRRAAALWGDVVYTDPVELDGMCDCGPVFALLSHAPREAQVQVHVNKEGFAALWGEILVPDSACLAQLAFLGSGAALQVAVVDLAEAHDVLGLPDKAGWLKVTWN